MSTWYYAGAEREQLGPLSTDDLKTLFRAGGITLETLVWREGMLQWRPLGDVAESLGLLQTAAPKEESGVPMPPSVVAPAPPAREERVLESALSLTGSADAAAVSGRAVFSLGTDPGIAPTPVQPRPEAFTPVATPAFESNVAANPYAAGRATLHEQPEVRHDEHIVHAGFWKRAAASIIDSFILGIVGALLGELLGTVLSDITGAGKDTTELLSALCTLMAYALYYAWFHSTLNYATPGKMAIGIKVVRSDGEPISFLRAFARFFATFISMLPLFLGYVMAAFTSRKQSLHDLICDTVVVDKWAYTAKPEQQRSELGMVAIIVLSLYALLIVLSIIGVFLLGLAGAAMLRG